jgi:hypothetical protein
VTDPSHPALRIMAQRAAESGLDVATINASAPHRTVMSLIIEVLDLAIGPIVAHPELLATAALTLHSYAALLERSEEVIADSPEFQKWIKQHHHCHP